MSWLPNLLMALGGLLWLGGELWGVYRNSTVKNPGRDTTSQWVWLAEAKFPVLKVLITVFFVSLIGHFLYHWMLLP